MTGPTEGDRLGRSQSDPDARTIVLDPDGVRHVLLLRGQGGFEERIHVVGDPPARFTEENRNWVTTGETEPGTSDEDVWIYREIEDIF